MPRYQGSHVLMLNSVDRAIEVVAEGIVQSRCTIEDSSSRFFDAVPIKYGKKPELDSYAATLEEIFKSKKPFGTYRICFAKEHIQAGTGDRTTLMNYVDLPLPSDGFEDYARQIIFSHYGEGLDRWVMFDVFVAPPKGDRLTPMEHRRRMVAKKKQATQAIAEFKKEEKKRQAKCDRAMARRSGQERLAG